MHRILIADSLHASGLDLLREAGCDLHLLTAEERPRLAELVADADALVVRSATRVTAELLEAGKRLRVVGRAGIGVDNVDVAAATKRGVLVVNAPTANMISAVEHTFAVLLALARNVPQADRAIKDEVWDRKGFIGRELQGKTLGIVGFGRIGQQVAARGRAFDMRILAHDPYLDDEIARRAEAEPRSLDELLAESDVVSLHTPMTNETRGMIGARQIARMRPGALLVNCARGGLVDEEALVAALDSGQLGGAALDVFAEEPPSDWRLAAHPRVVATPHLGAQTHEAQERIAAETARTLLAALSGSLSVAAVNLPFRTTGTRGEPFLALAEQLGRFAGSLLAGGTRRLEVDLWGVEEGLRSPITVAAIKGLLTPYLGVAVNYVNAEAVARERQLEVVRSTHHAASDYAQLIGVTASGPKGEVSVAGTLFGDRDARVVRFGSFRLEFRPEGLLLVLRNRDVPGVVGRLGTILGEAGVNIAGIHLAREDGGGDALAVLRLDQEAGSEVIERLLALPEVYEAAVVDLGNR